MRGTRLAEAYHIERALAARQGIGSYPCGCEKCHGFKIQIVQTVETHHRKYGRDQKLQEPLLVSILQYAVWPSCTTLTKSHLHGLLQITVDVSIGL